MKTYTIDSENSIMVHASRKAAAEVSDRVFSTEEQFADLIGPDNKRLVEIWNSLPGVKPVSKFTNRKVATERIWKAIQGLGGSAAAEAATDALPVVKTPFDEIGPAPSPASEPEPAVVSPEQASATASEPLAPVGAQVADVAPAEAKASTKTTRAKKAPKAPKEANAAKSEGVREGSKTASVVALMKREGGATLTEVMLATGWQAHSVRGFVSGTLGKKMGLTVNSTKGEDGERRYSINS
jgi:hypothetical protein